MLTSVGNLRKHSHGKKHALCKTTANTLLYLGAVACWSAEAATIRIVGAAEGLLRDGQGSITVVAVHPVPDHLAPSNHITMCCFNKTPGGVEWGGERGQGGDGVIIGVRVFTSDHYFFLSAPKLMHLGSVSVLHSREMSSKRLGHKLGRSCVISVLLQSVSDGRCCKGALYENGFWGAPLEVLYTCPRNCLGRRK